MSGLSCDELFEMLDQWRDGDPEVGIDQRFGFECSSIDAYGGPLPGERTRCELPDGRSFEYDWYG